MRGAALSIVLSIVLFVPSLVLATNLSIPLDLKWGDSPEQVEATLKKRFDTVWPMEASKSPAFLLYIASKKGKEDLGLATVGEKGLVMFDGLFFFKGGNDGQVAAKNYVELVVHSILKTSNAKIISGRGNLYTIYTPDINVEINMDSVQTDGGKHWRVGIKYLPQETFKFPDNNYSYQINNIISKMNKGENPAKASLPFGLKWGASAENIIMALKGKCDPIYDKENGLIGGLILDGTPTFVSFKLDKNGKLVFINQLKFVIGKEDNLSGAKEMARLFSDSCKLQKGTKIESTADEQAGYKYKFSSSSSLILIKVEKGNKKYDDFFKEKVEVVRVLHIDPSVRGDQIISPSKEIDSIADMLKELKE